MFTICQLFNFHIVSGDEGIRTPDPLLARQVLSQLSYTPKFPYKAWVSLYIWVLFFLSFPFQEIVGLRRLELPTSRLSGVRSNRLSYKPLPALSLPGSISEHFSVFHSFLCWQPPILPHRLQCSTVGRLRLNRRVRDGYGCFP